MTDAKVEPDQSGQQILTFFHDGECPLCQAEVIFLKHRNRRGLIRFVDVSEDSYDPGSHTLSRACALAKMNGRVGDGPLIEGIAVFAEAYKRADLPLLAWIFSRRWLAPMLGTGYRFFARHRYTIARLFGPPLRAIARRRYPGNA